MTTRYPVPFHFTDPEMVVTFEKKRVVVRVGDMEQAFVNRHNDSRVSAETAKFYGRRVLRELGVRV